MTNADDILLPSHWSTTQRLPRKQAKDNLRVLKSSSAIAADKRKFCEGFSTLCLKAGQHCRHPKCANGVQMYKTRHVGYVTTELTRAFPIGSVTFGPKQMTLDITQLNPDSAQSNVDQLFTQRRLRRNRPPNTGTKMEMPEKPEPELSVDDAGAGWQTQCPGNLLERLQQGLAQQYDSKRTTMSSPMHVNDMLAAYFYRKVQASVAVHVCQVGYCRKSKTEPCKYRLPAEEIVLADEPNDEAVLTKHRLSLIHI